MTALRWIATTVLTGGLALAGTLGMIAARASLPRPAAAMHRLPSPQPRVSPTPRIAPAGYVVRHVLTLPGPVRHGDWYWDERGAPADGEVVVTVDLQAQSLSVFRAGYEIGTAVIVFGADSKPTPLGVFRISQKDARHVSSLYDAPMPYMLRLTDDGVSIHGSAVGPDLMTHGCVGVPTAFARRLFGVVATGTMVIVTRGERLAVGDRVTAI